ncbi:MAG TPA: hypothetical protein VK806_05230 [Bacteroidia bacterium]|nr:hypothetical protein [Bacteroidia bacterium]
MRGTEFRNKLSMTIKTGGCFNSNRCVYTICMQHIMNPKKPTASAIRIKKNLLIESKENKTARAPNAIDILNVLSKNLFILIL